jgi:hypothetical protein
MANNRSNPKSEMGLRNVAISLILGIISIVLPFILIGYGVNYVPGRVFLLVMFVAGICAIFGLNFGIKGLKSIRRKLAIVGIAVCVISLLFWMYLLLGWLMSGGLIGLL